MFNNLLNKAGSFLGNLFSPQQMVSPLPEPMVSPEPAGGFQTQSWNPASDVGSTAGRFVSNSNVGSEVGRVGGEYSSEPYIPPSGGGGGGNGMESWDEQWYRLHPGEGARPEGYHGEGGSGGDPISNLLNTVMNPLQQAIQEWNNRLSEFDKNNPFSFDEAQAKASAAERLNPYYDATLNEYITGWRRSSQRSTEDMTRTVGELNADASKLSERERFSTQEAIRQSEEGYAGSGLFFSGQRQRDTGTNEVQGIWKQGDIATNLERGIGSFQRANTRTQEDLALQKARTERLTEAERTTALQTDIANQKKEAQVKRGLEQLAYAGPQPGGNFANQLSMQNQLFGMY